MDCLIVESFCINLSPLDTFFIDMCDGDNGSLDPADFFPAAVPEEGRAPILERTERVAVLPRLSVPVSLLRFKVPDPPAVCFIVTAAESLVCFIVPSEVLTPSVVSGKSGDFTRDMDDLGIGWAPARSFEDNFFFTLALAATEDLPLDDLVSVDF